MDGDGGEGGEVDGADMRGGVGARAIVWGGARVIVWGGCVGDRIWMVLGWTVTRSSPLFRRE
jgi:hypothetical protein